MKLFKSVFQALLILAVSICLFPQPLVLATKKSNKNPNGQVSKNNRRPKRRDRRKHGPVIIKMITKNLIYIHPGQFQMGSENGRDDEKPVHLVNINYGFYIGKYEVTQKEWKLVMGDSPSSFKGDNLPVEFVSWNDAQKFLHRLNRLKSKFYFRLPSEAEWEYACRAGTTGDFAGELESICWYGYNTGQHYHDTGVATHPVGKKQPNAWGLYDMHGNVREWCQDAYSSYQGAPTDGSAWEGDRPYRIVRGGAWNFNGYECRSANRLWEIPDFKGDSTGLRIVAVKRTLTRLFISPRHK